VTSECSITTSGFEFRGVNQAAWEHYHECRRTIAREYLGIWSDPSALLDASVLAARNAEHAALRAEMRSLSVTCPGAYFVPVYA
jgi:hypothetical protein